MPDFKAIVFDVDGTLLDSGGCMSERTLDALHECRRKGIVLYAATGRPQRLVFRAGEVNGDASFLRDRGVFYNGAMAVDESLRYVRHRKMPAELVEQVVGHLVEVVPDLQIAIQNEEEYHSYRLHMEDAELARWGFSRDELLPFDDASRLECSKIVAVHPTRDLAEAYRCLLQADAERLNAFLTDSRRCLQVTSREAGKEKALLDLLRLRGIAPEQVAVFGDDWQDLGMFRAFTHSVAMANAPAPLREAATYVTSSNDADGVVHALRDLLGII